jgi:hypothetical protein
VSKTCGQIFQATIGRNKVRVVPIEKRPEWLEQSAGMGKESQIRRE